VAWVALLAGLAEERGRRLRAARLLERRGSRRRRAEAPAGPGRREFLRAAVVGVGALFLGATSSLLSGQPIAATAGPRARAAGQRDPVAPGPGAAPSGSAPAGDVVASLQSVPVGGAVPFDDPAAGPAILCRLGADRVAAFSRVCTHAGCLVDYDRQTRLLFCPCHGAEFDPSNHAAPVAGPAPVSLQAIAVRIDRASGQVVASS